MTHGKAPIVAALALLAAAFGLSVARAQDSRSGGGVVLEDSRSSFTTSTPGPYVRFFAHNVSTADHVLRVVSVKLLRPLGRPLPLPISRVTADDRPVTGALTLRPDEGPLVVVWFDDSTRALAAEHDEVVYQVRVTVDGVASELTVRVTHAIREPSR